MFVMWPVRCQTYDYLPSRKAPPSISWYQIILLGDRGTCVLTTCPGLHLTARRLGPIGHKSGTLPLCHEPHAAYYNKIVTCHSTRSILQNGPLSILLNTSCTMTVQSRQKTVVWYTTVFYLNCGVPQGSVLGPKIVITYPLSALVHNLLSLITAEKFFVNNNLELIIGS